MTYRRRTVVHSSRLVNQENPTAKAVGFLLSGRLLGRPVESADSTGVPGSPCSPLREAPLGDQVGSVPSSPNSPILQAREWAGLTQRSHLEVGRDGNRQGRSPRGEDAASLPMGINCRRSRPHLGSGPSIEVDGLPYAPTEPIANDTADHSVLLTRIHADGSPKGNEWQRCFGRLEGYLRAVFASFDNDQCICLKTKCERLLDGTKNEKQMAFLYLKCLRDFTLNGSPMIDDYLSKNASLRKFINNPLPRSTELMSSSACL